VRGRVVVMTMGNLPKCLWGCISFRDLIIFEYRSTANNSMEYRFKLENTEYFEGGTLQCRHLSKFPKWCALQLEDKYSIEPEILNNCTLIKIKFTGQHFFLIQGN
jgi:hypothetical protein